MKKILMLLFLFSSCGLLEDDNHDFYYSPSIGSMLRFPLIQPYVLCSENDNPIRWRIDFLTDSISQQYQYHMKKVGICKRIIVLYTDSGSDFGKPEWYLVDTKEKEERSFFDSVSFQKKLKSKIKSNIKWYVIDSVYHDFDKYGKYPPGWPRKSAYDTVSKNDNS